VLSGPESFYGRISRDHFVGKRVSGLVCIESAVDFKVFGKKKGKPCWKWGGAGSGYTKPMRVHGKEGNGIDCRFAEYDFFGVGVFDIEAAYIFSGAFCHADPSYG
jgi:hypothetical protein